MHNLEEIKERFLKNNVATRLGCIAADLARLNSFSRMPNNQRAINDLIQESKFFIEWTAPAVPAALQKDLLSLQLKLALCSDSPSKKKITAMSNEWSKKILKSSSLIK
jgi:hypothetical protein